MKQMALTCSRIQAASLCPSERIYSSKAVRASPTTKFSTGPSLSWRRSDRNRRKQGREDKSLTASINARGAAWASFSSMDCSKTEIVCSYGATLQFNSSVKTSPYGWGVGSYSTQQAFCPNCTFTCVRGRSMSNRSFPKTPMAPPPIDNVTHEIVYPLI